MLHCTIFVFGWNLHWYQTWRNSWATPTTGPRSSPSGPWRMPNGPRSRRWFHNTRRALGWKISKWIECVRYQDPGFIWMYSYIHIYNIISKSMLCLEFILSHPRIWFFPSWHPQSLRILNSWIIWFEVIDSKPCMRAAARKSCAPPSSRWARLVQQLESCHGKRWVNHFFVDCCDPRVELTWSLIT